MNEHARRITTVCYIVNARIPTEKAHGLQILKMCEAFQSQGAEIELIVPFRVQSDAMRDIKNVWDYYDIKTRFRIRRLFSPDFIPCDRILPQTIMLGLYYFQGLFFSLAALIVSLFTPKDVYYSRDLQTIFWLCLTKVLHRKKIFFEAHELHGCCGRTGVFAVVAHRLMRWMMPRLDGIVVITDCLKQYYRLFGVAEEDILTAPDGVDEKRFSAIPSKHEARQKLDLPLDKKIICYLGHLFEWKGVYTLAESAEYLSEACTVYIVGGMPEDVSRLQQFVNDKSLDHVVLTGYVPYIEVPFYLGAADVLVLPNSSEHKISREYTSPLKLFEYMAAKRPLVASDLPSLREILRHNDNACLVKPDDPQHLAQGVLDMLREEELAERLAVQAYNDVQAYTWEKRAVKILRFLAIKDR